MVSDFGAGIEVLFEPPPVEVPSPPPEPVACTVPTLYPPHEQRLSKNEDGMTYERKLDDQGRDLHILPAALCGVPPAVEP